MTTVLIVVHLMIVIALVAVVLVQRSEGGALGIGGGGGGFFTSRGTANLLTRSTAVLAALFFATSLALTLLGHYQARPTSLLQNLGGGAGQAIPNSSQGDGKGILGTLQGLAPAGQTPAAPAGTAPAPAPQPTGPQVPNSQ